MRSRGRKGRVLNPISIPFPGIVFAGMLTVDPQPSRVVASLPEAAPMSCSSTSKITASAAADRQDIRGGRSLLPNTAGRQIRHPRQNRPPRRLFRQWAEENADPVVGKGRHPRGYDFSRRGCRYDRRLHGGDFARPANQCRANLPLREMMTIITFPYACSRSACSPLRARPDLPESIFRAMYGTSRLH